jgi:WD40 repeat protein
MTPTSRAASPSISIGPPEPPPKVASRALLVAGVLWLAAFLPGIAARAEEHGASASPILRIETGMHEAVINRLALADDGRELITVSDDKTARRWSLADGSAKGVWRIPIGEGDLGALYAVAASGDRVAVGGHTGARKAEVLYLFDARSSQMRSIPGFAQPISALAFSRDGQRLAVGEQNGALVLIDLANSKLVGQDLDYGDTVEWIAFAPDGRFATSSTDGKLRLYDPEMKRLASAPLSPDPKSGERPWGLAFSPDGRRLAVGSFTAAKLRIFASDGARLAPERTLDGAPGTQGALSVVAWSADGGMLAAAGSYSERSEQHLIRFWQLRGNDVGAGKDSAAARGTITDLALLADGRAVYVSGEPAFGIVDADGKTILRRESGKADFRGAWRDALRVSHDGAVVDFSTQEGGKRRQRFDLLAGSLLADAPARDDLRPPLISSDRVTFADWRDGARPSINDHPVRLEEGERVHALGILPGAGAVALGTNFYLRLERTGAGSGQGRASDSAAEEAWRTILPAPAWSVNASGDGRYVLAALGDGTIRWYASGDGHEVMALFVDPRDRRWVVWVPEGFFDHSPRQTGSGGETLVGYHLNNGPNKLADFIEIGQLYNLFYRRDLVLAKFRRGPAGERQVMDQLAHIGDARAVLKGGLPPRLEMLEACLRPSGAQGCADGTSRKPADPTARELEIAGSGNELFARYRIENRGGGLGRVVIRRNDAAIEGVRVVERADAQQRIETAVLPLDPERNEIRFATESGSTAIQSRDDDDFIIEAKPSPKSAAAGSATGRAGARLFAVAIGVSAYRQADFRLANAANDARTVADLLRRPSPPVYERAEIVTLLDDDATAPKIVEALEHVAAASQPQDIVVIFLSGHGQAVDGKYFFAPVEFATRHPDRIAEARRSDEHRQAEIIDDLFRADGVGEAQLLPVFERIQGNVLLVLDTCYSATLANKDAVERNAQNETVANGVGHRIGRFILAGARSLALDSNGDTGDGGGKNGLFTTYFIKGLEGDADLEHNGRIEVDNLLKFTRKRVREESQKLNLDQEPTFYFSGSNFFEIRAVAAH